MFAFSENLVWFVSLLPPFWDLPFCLITGKIWQRPKYASDDCYLTKAATEGVLKKKALRKKFTIFTGKYLCWSLFLIKLQAFMCVTVNITKVLRTSVLKNVWHRLFPTSNNVGVLILFFCYWLWTPICLLYYFLYIKRVSTESFWFSQQSFEKFGLPTRLRRSVIYIFNFEQISHIVLVFP